MSVALYFAEINLAIITNDLEKTKEVVEKLNTTVPDATDIYFNALDMQVLSERFNNESFRYFLMNFNGNQATNKELWYFLSNFLPVEYKNGRIAKEDLADFLNRQMALNFYDANREYKYYALIKIAMLLEDYETINLIKARLQEDK